MLNESLLINCGESVSNLLALQRDLCNEVCQFKIMTFPETLSFTTQWKVVKTGFIFHENYTALILWYLDLDLEAITNTLHEQFCVQTGILVHEKIK